MSCVIRLFIVRHDGAEAYAMHVPIRCGNSDTWVAFACWYHGYGRGFFFSVCILDAPRAHEALHASPHSHGCVFGQGTTNGPSPTIWRVFP